MDVVIQKRLSMALIGAMAGVGLYLVSYLIDENLFAPRVTLALSVFAVTFFSALLVTAGPLATRKAAIYAAALAAVLVALVGLASLRFADIGGMFSAPIPVVAAFVLASLPLPFFIAAAGPGWRDYPTLFTESWSIFVRAALAWAFVGLFWALILLSNALFELVGMDLIDTLLDIEFVPWLITGVVLGLALAVVAELAGFLAPQLVLRLLRLLLPPVLVVLVVFVLALPFRGLSGLFGDFSVAAILLAMVAVGAALVAAAIDQTDAQAVAGPAMRRAAQALALVLLVPAALAGYSVWLRVGQYGWTPERLFAATASVIALGYALGYAAAIGRGAAWMARIRSWNVAMALALIAVAALWLTPVLNPEAISTNSQMARFEASGDVAALDFLTMNRWGHAGAEAVAGLQVLADDTGNVALQQKLWVLSALGPDPVAPDIDALRVALVAAMPLQPATATATRDMLLAAADQSDLANWLNNCEAKMPDGAPGCVMVVADLWTNYPGEEAMLVQRNGTYFVTFEGLLLDQGVLQSRPMLGVGGDMPNVEEGSALIAALQKAPPALSAAPINQISIGDTTLFVAP